MNRPSWSPRPSGQRPAHSGANQARRGPLQVQRTVRPRTTRSGASSDFAASARLLTRSGICRAVDRNPPFPPTLKSLLFPQG